jgi:hypothetical protein
MQKTSEIASSPVATIRRSLKLKPIVERRIGRIMTVAPWLYNTGLDRKVIRVTL